MRVFDFPAEYRPHVEAAVSMALAEIKRDQAARAAGKRRTIPDGFTDPSAKGRAIAWVGTPNSLSTGAKRAARTQSKKEQS